MKDVEYYYSKYAGRLLKPEHTAEAINDILTERDAELKAIPIEAGTMQNISQTLDGIKIEHINYKGYDYSYEYRLAKDGIDICLATKDPKKYCNGFYLYSTKDPGDGKAFVVVDTNDPTFGKEKRFNK